MSTQTITTADPIPASFRYFQNLNTAVGVRVAAFTGRFVSGSLTLPDDVARELGRDRARGDVLSDALVDAAFAGGWSRRLHGMVDQALDHGIDSVADAPPELVALFEHLDAQPDWLDWARVERGAQVLRRYGVDAFYYFGLISLEGYRVEMIHKPLVLTGTYTGGTAFGRYLETCRFWLDTSEPGGLRPGAAGRKAAVSVRVMHSMIRRKVAAHPEWDADRLGVPLSQNSQMGPITLSFVINQHAKLIGYWPSDAEILDHMHLWRYIGYLMGIEPSYYPETIEDWWRLTYLMFSMDSPADGDDSRRLSQSFVAAFGPTARDDRETRRSRAREQRTVLGWTRFFLTEETFTANQLPTPAPWQRWLPLLRLPGNLRDELGRRMLPAFAGRLDERKRRERRTWLERHSDGGQARFTPVDKLAG
jgi:hypothetical protein